MNEAEKAIGTGPYQGQWPDDHRLDSQLLEKGDKRNVIDKYRYWTVEAIKADLDAHRTPLEIAVENVSRDFNMGTIIRNANAFNVARVHIIGSKQWNKRGAMRTDTYMHIDYHADVAAFVDTMRQRGKTIVGVDIIPGAIPLHTATLPDQSVLVFGAEGPGLSEELIAQADSVVMIEQSGSTRSVNVGVASGIAMYAWSHRHSLTC